MERRRRLSLFKRPSFERLLFERLLIEKLLSKDGSSESMPECKFAGLAQEVDGRHVAIEVSRNGGLASEWMRKLRKNGR